jgi:hypothetical protein
MASRGISIDFAQQMGEGANRLGRTFEKLSKASDTIANNIADAKKGMDDLAASAEKFARSKTPEELAQAEWVKNRKTARAAGPRQPLGALNAATNSRYRDETGAHQQSLATLRAQVAASKTQATTTAEIKGNYDGMDKKLVDIIRKENLLQDIHDKTGIRDPAMLKHLATARARDISLENFQSPAGRDRRMNANAPFLRSGNLSDRVPRAGSLTARYVKPPVAAPPVAAGGGATAAGVGGRGAMIAGGVAVASIAAIGIAAFAASKGIGALVGHTERLEERLGDLRVAYGGYNNVLNATSMIQDKIAKGELTHTVDDILQGGKQLMEVGVDAKKNMQLVSDMANYAGASYTDTASAIQSAIRGDKDALMSFGIKPAQLRQFEKYGENTTMMKTAVLGFLQAQKQFTNQTQNSITTWDNLSNRLSVVKDQFLDAIVGKPTDPYSLGNTIKGVFKDIVDFITKNGKTIKQIGSAIGYVLKWVINSVRKMFDGLGGWMQGLMDRVSGWFGNFRDRMMSVLVWLELFKRSVFAVFKNVYNFYKNFWVGMYDLAAGTLERTWNKLTEWGSRFYNWIKSGPLGSALTWLEEKLKPIGKILEFTFKMLTFQNPQGANGGGGNMISSLLDAAQKGTKGLTNISQSFANAAASYRGVTSNAKGGVTTETDVPEGFVNTNGRMPAQIMKGRPIGQANPLQPTSSMIVQPGAITINAPAANSAEVARRVAEELAKKQRELASRQGN